MRNAVRTAAIRRDRRLQLWGRSDDEKRGPAWENPDSPPRHCGVSTATSANSSARELALKSLTLLKASLMYSGSMS
jgi:hypothetical protein